MSIHTIESLNEVLKIRDLRVERVQDGGDRFILHLEEGEISIGEISIYLDPHCCNSGEVTDMDGDIDSLEGQRLVSFEEVEIEDFTGVNLGDHQEEYEAFFYKFQFSKEPLTVTFVGSSNGFYTTRASVSINIEDKESK